MFILVIRTVILYFFLLIIMRLMGKRQLGQLEPFDLVTALMISELAALPMEDNRMPLISSMIPITTLVILQIITSILQLKSEKARTLLNGEPSILIKDGEVDLNELRNQRFNLDDLLEELRLNGYFNLSDIHYAILETNGNISIMPKEENTPITPKFLNIKVQEKSMPMIIINDGTINKQNLEKVGKNMKWVNKQLIKNNIKSYKDVFIGIVYEDDKFFYQLKNNNKK
ncbi:MAG: DUF421 domain-containing protein [Clostridium argentinense]|uniref:DUF421 domain-containing protein n=1 Tax=Clostridium faecium TaxID=2762223 RepID=A0ABR8YP67_9CLOT|nr:MULTISPECIES: DUF421 domain-containing protein [Clostridium]MBD8046042.1 DUF421 domain-containing protein [Clostridium faecium]MBS5822891.1 DUF421 domain-containing protein [Clostridium argentinense]MDU1349096.1 DUF421 domain-containing protein [Clostridium argentinense]